MITFARVAVLLGCLVVPTVAVHSWVRSAQGRVVEAGAEEVPEDEQVAVAAAADEGYCSADLKKVLRRVLLSCGLMGGESARGCQPLQAQSVIAGSDFNALFQPMKDRGAIIQFDLGKSELDDADRALI